MYIPFEKITPLARVWIYTSDQQLPHEQINDLENQMAAFINGWTSHGEPVTGSSKVLHQRFLILAADENLQPTSGCAIDTSIKFIQAIGATLGVDLMCRKLIIETADGQVAFNYLELKHAINSGSVLPSDLVYDHSKVQTVADLREKWIVPIQQTWAARYLPHTLV